MKTEWPYCASQSHIAELVSITLPAATCKPPPTCNGVGTGQLGGRGNNAHDAAAFGCRAYEEGTDAHIVSAIPADDASIDCEDAITANLKTSTLRASTNPQLSSSCTVLYLGVRSTVVGGAARTHSAQHSIFVDTTTVKPDSTTVDGSESTPITHTCTRQSSTSGEMPVQGSFLQFMRW